MSPPPPPLIFGINTAHAQTNTAPTIALAADTGSSPSDGITNNGVVNVSGLADGATWKYVTDGGSTFTAGSGSSFTLPEGVYDANDVQVVQTVSGTDSAPALLGAVTVDTTGPELVRHNDKFADGEINTEQTHTFIFSEPVTGLEVGDFTGASVTVNRVIDSGDHITYTLYFTPSSRAATIGGNLLLSRNAVTDLAGNMGPSDRADVSALNTGGGSNTVVAADTTAPTVDFGTIDVGVIGAQQTHTIRFNQIVSGFAATDITATGATVNSRSGSGSTYMITFTPTLTSFTLTLAADSVSDTAATPNTGPATEPAAARSVTGSATAPVVTNLPPVANAGDDFSVTASTTGVTLDGTDSTDSDGTIESYEWAHTMTGGVATTPSTAITVADGETSTFTAPDTAADLVFTLTVTDDDAATHTDMVTITVTAPVANIAPTADAGDDFSVTASTTGVTLDGSDSTDSDGTIQSYEWAHTMTGGVATTPSTAITVADGVTSTFTAPDTAGALIFTLTVTDEDAATHADTVTITVTAPTEPDEEEKAKAAEAAIAEVILSEVVRVVADQSISAIVGRVERARTQPNGTGFNFAGQQMSLAGNANANGGANAGNSMSSTLAGMMNTHAQALADDTLDMKSLLGNSEFTMPLNALGGAGTGSGTTLWGSGDYRSIDGEDEVNDRTLDWDGDLFSLHLGVDTRITPEIIGGVAVSWSEGEIDYNDGSTTGTGKKTYDTSMVSINPYFSWGNEYGEVWMTAGYGEGELEMEDANGGNKTNHDLSMQTFAIGGNSVLLQRGADTLRLKGEISQSSLEVEQGKPGSLDEMEVDANRIRLSLESTNTVTWGNGARTDRKVELGARHDGGDGVTGTGIELGLGLRHISASGLSIEGKLRALLGHKGDINEWGISGTIKQSAGADGQGFSFALSPGYGDDSSDLQRLWEHGLRDVDGNASSGTTDPDGNADPDTARTRAYSARLDARIGYGVNGFTAPSWLGSGSGLLTPYTSMTLSDDSNRYRLGVQWKFGERIDLDLVGEHRDAADDDNVVLLKGELRF